MIKISLKNLKEKLRFNQWRADPHFSIDPKKEAEPDPEIANNKSKKLISRTIFLQKNAFL